MFSVKKECIRCGQLMYPLESIGPIMQLYYHKCCFTCFKCNTHLDLKTYSSNTQSLKDKNVYCRTHAPNVSNVSLNTIFVPTRKSSEQNLKE
jgi:hypothetical protein